MNSPTLPTVKDGTVNRSANLFETEVPSISLPHSLNLREFLLSSTAGASRIQWRNNSDRSESLAFEYAHPHIAHQVVRWTGWVGNIGEHQAQLPELVDGFRGVKGFHLFSGTQIRSCETGQVIPTIQDVPVTLRKTDQDLRLVGIIPKVTEEPKVKDGLGTIMSVEAEAGYFSTINDDQDLGIVQQPDVNGVSERLDEVRESRRQCGRLLQKKWSATLVVFGGRATKDSDLKLTPVEQELVWWAEDARNNPDWKINIILLRGSGGVADLYANNTAWLEQNPAVKVVDVKAESIRSAISGLKDVVTDWQK